MSYNGTGTFNINTAGQPVVTGTTITSTAFNLLTADLATGLTTALTKDGQTTPTANIPMGTFKITGLGAGSAATDAAQYGQLQTGATKIATVTGTDTLTGTLTPALAAYATGNLFSFVAANTNTGATTINLNSLGAKSITKSGTTALVAGDLVSGQVYLIEYDGTRFQLINPSSTSSSVSSITFGSTGLTPSTATSGAVTVAGTLAIANGGTGTTSTTFVNAATNVTGTLPIANGGTGLTTTPANGALDIGNGTGFTRTTLTAGTGIAITNGSGSITIASTSTAVSPIGTDITYGDYTLTLPSAVSSTTTAPFVQTVSIDANKELLLIYRDLGLQAVVFDNSTKTFGTVVLVRTADLSVVSYVAVTNISSSAVLVCSLPSGGAGTALETVVLSISGSTITVNTALATTLAAASQLIAPNTRLVTVGSSYVLNYYDASTIQQRFRAITVSGVTPSIGAELAYAGGTDGSLHHSYAISSSVLLAFSSATGTVYTYPISVSGTTLTGGTAATVTSSTSTDIVTGLLSTNNVALLYRTGSTASTAAVVSVTGTIATISNATPTITLGTYSPQMQVFSNQAFVCTGTTGTDRLNVITDTAGVATVGTAITIGSANTRIFGFLSTGKVLTNRTNLIDGAYLQYGISSGSPVLEKTFAAMYISTGLNSVTQTPYTFPLSGLPNSNTLSTVALTLRLSTGKTVPFGNSNTPFSFSSDGTSTSRLQQSAYTVTTRAVNSSLSTAVGWGIYAPVIGSTTSFQIRRVELT
jgi:hypothetical protein